MNIKTTQDRLNYAEELFLKQKTLDLRIAELKRKKQELYKTYWISKSSLERYSSNNINFKNFKLK